MGWVRFHRRYGAWPGLAALVLQIVLSFGHIHVGQVHVSNVHFDAIARVSGAVADALRLTPPHLASAPAQKIPAQHHGDDEDYCAICASIFLASTSLAAQPPQLPVPLVFARIALAAEFERGVSASRPAFFQSRAPPAA
jgi:hypothetical protein